MKLYDRVKLFFTKKYSVWITIAVVYICCLFLFIGFAPETGVKNQPETLRNRIDLLKNAVSNQEYLRLQLVSESKRRARLSNWSPIDAATQHDSITIPVLVFACNRVTVRRALDSLFTSRAKFMSTASRNSVSFPIIVSHGCEHKDTRNVLNTYSDNITIWEFRMTASPTKKPITSRERVKEGYRSLTHHYNSSLNRVFTSQSVRAVIIVEDDLEVATDFFEYFAATYHLLANDDSLFCVSAWNDNGRPPLIDQNRNDLIHRSDFFPGLGWMMLRSFWMQVRAEWPDIYWDEYIRKPKVRLDRACLRPEIGRTITFGERGVSQGQYFKRYLGSMLLNTVAYPFTKSNLSYLIKSDYDLAWFKAVYIDSEELSVDALQKSSVDTADPDQSFRVTYTTQKSFENIATALKMMPDAKSGVVRNAYHGAVSVRWNNHWLYIAPPSSWSGYDVKWQ